MDDGEVESCTICRADVDVIVRVPRRGWLPIEGHRRLVDDMPIGVFHRRTRCSVCSSLQAVGSEALRHCVVCWQGYHPSCLQGRGVWSQCRTDPDVCHACARGAPDVNRRRRSSIAAAPSDGGSFHWPPRRLALPSSGAAARATAARYPITFSFVFVPLILCGLSTLPGAPVGGYLRRDDVAAWRRLVNDIFLRPLYVATHQALLPGGGGMASVLSFDALVDALGQVIGAIYNAGRGAAAIASEIVGPTGYIERPVQEAIMYPSNDLNLQLIAAGDPGGMLATWVFDDGYRNRSVGVADEDVAVTDPLAGQIGVRMASCSCGQCPWRDSAVLGVFLTCDGCRAVHRFACTGLSALPTGRWRCSECTGHVEAFGYDVPTDGAAHITCTSCLRAVHPTCMWTMGHAHVHPELRLCVRCALDTVCSRHGVCLVCNRPVPFLVGRLWHGAQCQVDVGHVHWQRAAENTGEPETFGLLAVRRIEHERLTASDADDLDGIRNLDRPTQWFDEADQEGDELGVEVDVDADWGELRTRRTTATNNDGGEDLTNVSDAEIWDRLTHMTSSEQVDRQLARHLITRIRARPRNERRPATTSALQLAARRLDMLFFAWHGRHVSVVPRDRHRELGSLLHVIGSRHRQEWGLVRAAHTRSASQPLTRAARQPGLLTHPSLLPAPSFVGVLRTGDDETDGQHRAAEYTTCAGCDAEIYRSEVVRDGGAVYGLYCCRRGQVALRPLEMHRDPELGALMRDMWLTRPARLSVASLGRRHGRLLNSTFAISCQSVNCRPMLTRGMQTYVVNTRIAHYLGPLLPQNDDLPQFAQLYVYDSFNNAPVGDQGGPGRPRYGHRDALQSYFTRSRTTTFGVETRDALLALVDRIRPMLMRVCALRPCLCSLLADRNMLVAGEPLCTGIAPCWGLVAPKVYRRSASCTLATSWTASSHVGGGRPGRKYHCQQRPSGNKQPVPRGNRTHILLCMHTRVTPVCMLWQVALLTSVRGLSNNDFVMHARGGPVHRLSFGNASFDPTYNVLLFPYGDQGWSEGLHLSPMHTTVASVLASDVEGVVPLADSRRRYITPCMFYAHRLQWRNGRVHEGGQCLMMAARLLQEYCCTAYARAEAQRLQWHRHNQDILRCDTIDNLRQARNEADRAGTAMPACGRGVRLGSSFVGGPRDIHNRYLDAMAVVATLRKPSLFITMTCNPKWSEIVQSLPFDIKAEDRPDITCRVFKAKLEALISDLVDKHILGVVVAIMSVVEFQYRGLPHAHILVILDGADEIYGADEIDKVVRAELPPRTNPNLRSKVLQHMIHNDCQANPAECMCCQRTGRCRWKFPHPFSEATTWTDHELYPKYKRSRAPNEWEYMPNGRVVTNEWVASYNPWLIEKYDCHLNVEVCASLEAVRYLYKYIYKGPDRANVRVVHQQTGDEVSMYEDMRYFGACESVWRIFGFNLYLSRPPVERLNVHLDGQMSVLYRAGNERRAADRVPVSKLEDWMFFCRAPNQENLPSCWRTLTYSQFPGYFTHERRLGWRGRVNFNRFRTVGRMPPARLANEEQFYLRRWLCHVTSGEVHDHLQTLPTFQPLRIVDLAMGCPTFKDLCVSRGLASDDSEWRWALMEASTNELEGGMRSLFVEIVTFNQPSNAAVLFDEFFRDFMYARELRDNADVIHRVAGQGYDIQQVERAFAIGAMHDELRSAGCTDWRTHLPMTDIEKQICAALQRSASEPRMIQQELDYNRQTEARHYAAARTAIANQPSQLAALDYFVKAVEEDTPKLLFLSAYAGCGKTFIVKAMLSFVRSRGEIALAVASTGIAALLLDGGVTLHSRFKVPLNANCDSMLNILAQSHDAALIRRAKVLIWDEAVMNNVHILHAMDRSLRLLRNNDDPMGGLTVVMGGVFVAKCATYCNYTDRWPGVRR